MHQRQNGSALVVILIIRLGNCGRGRNRGNLADADGTAGDAKPRLVDDDCLDLGNLMRAEQPQLSVFVDGLSVFIDRVLLTQRVAHAHDDAAFDLPLARTRVDRLAHIVRRDDFFQLPGFFIENAHLRRIAISNV